MYALIDSNNFFVSCERLFRPDLAGQPVIVLSSNDGCAISRSNEAKALGIAMGEPIFKLRERFVIAAGPQPQTRTPHTTAATQPQPTVFAFSAHFGLYGDISERISSLLATMTPHIEIYSIDESFLGLAELAIPDYEAWGRAVAATIAAYSGIPVSVGIAPSKTLCKLAADYAKKHADTQGAAYLDPTKPAQATRTAAILAHSAVENVWGVGWRLAPRLRAEGVATAADLAHMRPQRAGQLMGVHGKQMQAELNGTNCLGLQQRTKPQQVISRGRQFGQDTRDLSVIEAAIAALTARACAELRRERQLATGASLTLRTNRNKPGYSRVQQSVHLYAPTADTGTITSRLVQALSRAQIAHGSYHKADVTLYGLVPADSLQTDVFGTFNHTQHASSTRRMQALDAITAKHGQGALRYAAEALSQTWQPRSTMRSPRYTSSWSELPEVSISGRLAQGGR